MTRTRVLTAAVLVPAVVGIVWFAPTWVVALCVGIVIVGALHEFFALGEKAGFRGYPWLTAFFSVWMVLYQWMPPEHGPYFLPFGLLPDLEMILLTFMFGVTATAVLSRKPTTEALSSAAMSAAGFVFVALPLSYLIRLHGTYDSGQALLLVLVVVWVGDSAAYFAGRSFGRLKLAPQVSPGKTLEGAVANLVASVLAALAFQLWLPAATTIQYVGVGVVASVAGQLGDLVESSWKRSAGVKDSGSLLPGHGGILDRIDALIFAAPAVWYYFGMVGWRW